MWELAEGGYQFHDWLHYNPSKEQVLADRASGARRQTTWRERHKLGSDTNPVSNGVTNGGVTGAPVPVPVPDLKERERARDLKEPVLDTAWIRLGKHYKTLFDAEHEGSRNQRLYDEQRIVSTDSKQFRKLLELVKRESERTGVGPKQLFEAAAQAFLRDPGQREKGLVLEYFARDFTRYVDVSDIATAS
jgi:hypothetical protein